MATSTGSVSSPGIGANLDVAGIVAKLMQVEQQPLIRLADKETSYKSKLSAIGTVKSGLSNLQTAAKALADFNKLQATRVTAADASVATATGSSGAATGSYTLEVTKLAQAQKLASAGQADLTSAFSTGTITFDFGTVDTTSGSFDAATGKYTDATFTNSGAGSKTVVIDGSNNTLAGIRDAINGAKIGVTASIVNDGSSSPYRLVLTETSTGKASSMKVSVDAAGSLQDLLSHDPSDNAGQALSETITAQNAEFKIDGIAVSKSSNTVSDAIEGVKLNLLKTNIGTPTKITIDRDATAITGTLNQFVTAYNQLRAKLKDLTAYDPATKTAGALNGDPTVRSIQSQLDNLLTAPLTNGTNAFTQLSQIGVTKQSDGSLAVKDSKLQDAIATNFSSIAQLFASVGTPSDSLVSYVGSTDKTAPGAFAVNITTVATQGTTTGEAGTPADLNIDNTNNTLQVQVDGVTATITLASGSYSSLSALAAEVQSKINGASAFSSIGTVVTANTAGGVLGLTSARYGSGSGVSITGGNGKANLVGASPVVAAGVDVAGTINGVAASGNGQFLIGATGDDSEDLKLKISGATGPRGTVNFGKGYASQLDVLLTSLLGSDGPLTARTDGINLSLQSLSKEKDRINDRLDVIQARYMKQFTALDVAMSNMAKTSSFLTQQLAALSKN
jgi:flagellar hook-associated protein 2